MAPRRYGLVSDTHGRVHADLFRIFSGVDCILHSGDVGGEDVLMELRLIAPVHAVRGNVDEFGSGLAPSLRVELPLGIVGLRHGHEDPSAQPQRVRSLLDYFGEPAPRVIMHGHSHLQYLEHRAGTWIVNPGSAGKPRLNTVASVCVLEWNDIGDTLAWQFHPLSW
ncbi:YfcE family phosphodiesterase [bacterium]|nr:YfcE family phosphodiesterase [bacterium]